MKAQDLVIPIYLDTNTLLDLLASIEGGYTTVENFTAESYGGSTTEVGGGGAGGGTVGFASLMSFFRLSDVSQDEQAKITESQRVHTYGSLLNRLRTTLIDRGWVKRCDTPEEWLKVRPSDFIELSGRFAPNPFNASIDGVLQFLELAIAVDPLITKPSHSSGPHGKTDATPTKRRSSSVQKKSQGSPSSSRPNDSLRTYQNLQTFFQAIVPETEYETAKTYVIEINKASEYRAVVSLFPSYLRDRVGAELPGGEFRLLGKVVKSISEDESIDLLRGTRLAGMNEEMLSPILTAFEQVGQLLNVPVLIRKIESPALLVVPIAVYV